MRFSASDIGTTPTETLISRYIRIGHLTGAVPSSYKKKGVISKLEITPFL
jgi:hypothetical protein